MGEPLLNRIRMVSLRVRSLSASEEWYTRKLGLRVIGRNEAVILLQAERQGGTVVALMEAADPSRFEQEATIHFTAPDIHRAYETLKGSGAADVEPIQSSGSLSAFCYDDDGQKAMIWSDFDPAACPDEIADLLSRFVPVLA